MCVIYKLNFIIGLYIHDKQTTQFHLSAAGLGMLPLQIRGHYSERYFTCAEPDAHLCFAFTSDPSSECFYPKRRTLFPEEAVSDSLWSSSRLRATVPDA